MHVQPEEIQAALDTGKPVWSHALGRFGRILFVDGGVVYGRGGQKSRGAMWCTTFHRPAGDEVRLVEREDKWVIENVWPKCFKATTANTVGMKPQSGGMHKNTNPKESL